MSTLTTVLSAGVQYDDFKGTVAADEENSLAVYLREQGLIESDEFVIAIELYAGLNIPGKPRLLDISVFVLKGEGRDSLDEQLKVDPVKARRVEIEMTADEFIKMYKRLSIVMTPKGLGLDGRTIES